MQWGGVKQEEPTGLPLAPHPLPLPGVRKS